DADALTMTEWGEQVDDAHACGKGSGHTLTAECGRSARPVFRGFGGRSDERRPVIDRAPQRVDHPPAPAFMRDDVDHAGGEYRLAESDVGARLVGSHKHITGGDSHHLSAPLHAAAAIG